MEIELPKNGSAGEMNRRQALRVGSVIGAGLLGTLSGSAGESDAPVNGIAEIRMKSTRLDELRRFYEEKLELPVVLKDDQLTVVAGSTRLIFSPTESTGDQPFYHYAFNIPENKIESARQWQKKRTPLLRRGKSEIIHFSGINAHSVYFNDPAGNIVEYIARHDLRNSASGEFGPEDMLYASEIGLVVDDVLQTVDEVSDSLGMNPFKGKKSKNFSPVGDAHALLILVPRNRKWFPAGKQAARVHPVQAMIRGTKSAQLHNADLNYRVNLARHT